MKNHPFRIAIVIVLSSLSLSCIDRKIPGSDKVDSGIDGGTDAAPDAQMQAPTMIYSVVGRTEPVWYKNQTVFQEVKLKATESSALINRLVWTYDSDISNSEIQDLQLVLNDIPIQQTVTWLDANHLEFELNQFIDRDIEMTFALQGTVNGGLCGELKFDIASVNDVGASNQNASEPAVIVEGPASQTPEYVSVEGIMLFLNSATPSGTIPGSGNNVTLLVFDFVSSFVGTMKEMPLTMFVSTPNESAQFSNFKLVDVVTQTVLSGPTNPLNCSGNNCTINFQDSFSVPGNCETRTYAVTADIASPASNTSLRIDVDSRLWTIEDTNGMYVSPQNFTDALNGSTLTIN